jgi:aryl-alcohol dehydrogenase-like predicted oxidoreductase
MTDSSQNQVGLKLRSLGRTGIRISEIGFGAWAIGGGAILGGHPVGFGSVDDKVSLAALQRAFELGVNFVDTADAYGNGHSERIVGQAVKNSPRRVHIATKVGTIRRDPDPSTKDFSKTYVHAACDRSLERLGVTMIDLYQLHNPPDEVIAGNEIWDALRELKDKSKIACYGISISRPEQGIKAIEKGDVDSIQVVYNLLERDAEKELFPLAERKSVSIIARVPLASGLLSGKYAPGHRFAADDHRSASYGPGKLEETLQRVEKFKFLAQGRTLAQAALKFCLANPAVSAVIPGIKTPQQSEENIAAAAAADLTKEELERLRTS